MKSTVSQDLVGCEVVEHPDWLEVDHVQSRVLPRRSVSRFLCACSSIAIFVFLSLALGALFPGGPYCTVGRVGAGETGLVSTPL